jgi:hypothetical protein
LGPWGEETCNQGISDTRLAAALPEDVILRDDRQDHPSDQVPVLADAHRDYRLHLHQPAAPVRRVKTKIKIALERNADKAGKGFCSSFDSS